MALQQELDRVPEKPGVYIYRDAAGKVIYVGKAVNLRRRVFQYFQDSRGQSPKTVALVQRIRGLETLVTGTEVEALILEENLIKQHRPKYNILLRDDKRYPYLKLTVDEAYPRLLVTRRPHMDGAKYYGPFVRVAAMRDTLRLAQRHLGLRQCDIEIDRALPRPCLYYDLGQCDAPCVAWGESQEAYQEHVRQARMLLEGKNTDLVVDLRQRMDQAARDQQYEKAARWRDALDSIEQVRERQRVVLAEPKDVDVIALAREQDEGAAKATIQIFFIRGGKLIERQSFRLTHLHQADAAEALAAFTLQYYAGEVAVPQEVILQHAIDEPQALRDWLSKKRGSRVELTFPQRGEKLALIKLVEENARETLRDDPEPSARRLIAPAKNISAALEQLESVLGLAGLPRYIEGFDISHIQGSQTVASMVVMRDGRPERREYRTYKIKTVSGVDDFASMREVVSRRYRRLLDENQALPDLIMVDGGKGQLSAAVEALRELGLERLPIFGLAKRLEEFYLPQRSDSVQLDGRAPGRLLIQRLRDEAHRFAITFHRKLRSKALVRSAVEDVPGVGPAMKKRLLGAFGSVAGIHAATDAALLEIPGLGPKLLKQLRDLLKHDSPVPAGKAKL